MKKVWLVLIALILIILAVIGVFIWEQQDNIKAVRAASQYSDEELQSALEESRESVTEAINSIEGITVRAPTDEEREAFQKGEITAEQLYEQILSPQPSASQDNDEKAESSGEQEPVQPSGESGGQSSTENPEAEQTKPENTVPETAAPEATSPEAEYERQLSGYIAEVYVLREEYTLEINSIIDEAKKEYMAMPKSEKTKAKLVSWAKGYYSKAVFLEADCDAKMDQLVADLTALIKANNGDLSIVSEIINSYASEKSLTKALYISELKKRGLF